ncbi:MAG: hypothetical protein V7719_09090 [Psychroserpens sp.]|uniref:hypothetical protein n=1 Tax=Psychroserpens sp. TaxID=2020870 RepID=UPI0030028EAE
MKKEHPANPLDKILNSEHPAIKIVINNLEEHEVQIKVSEIIDYNANKTEEVVHSFQIDDKSCFYPAS